jgi:hypothetical protein
LPLTTLVLSPDGGIFASGPDGLAHSDDAGDTWAVVAPGEAGHFAQLSIRADGLGWASSADHAHLLRTQDGGATWEVSPSPFGVLPIVALQAAPDQVFALTHDSRRNLGQLWRSLDNGQLWIRGISLHMPWPVAATHHAPPMIGLGTMAFVQQPDGNWKGVRVSDRGVIRRIAGDEQMLLALTTDGIKQSFDQGVTWGVLSGHAVLDTAAGQMMDIALHQGVLYILLAGGEVCAFSL